MPTTIPIKSTTTPTMATRRVADPSARPRTRGAGAATAVALLAALTVLTGACTTSTASAPVTIGPAISASTVPAGSYGTSSGSSATSATAQAARTATLAFSTQVDSATSGFVTAVGHLGTDVAAGDTGAAKADELAAQADYDAFRDLESGNAVNGASLDELSTDVDGATSFGGLHAVERDLWVGGPLATDVAALSGQAPVAQFLLGRERLGPEAVGRVAVDQLDWVVDTALPVGQEQFSHLGLVDVSATEQAAHRSFSAVQPLADLVEPQLSRTVAGGFATLDAEVAALGDPATTPDTTVTPAARLTLSRQLDATASTLARLSAALAPFGTSGGPS